MKPSSCQPCINRVWSTFLNQAITSFEVRSEILRQRRRRNRPRQSSSSPVEAWTVMRTGGVRTWQLGWFFCTSSCCLVTGSLVCSSSWDGASVSPDCGGEFWGGAFKSSPIWMVGNGCGLTFLLLFCLTILKPKVDTINLGLLRPLLLRSSTSSCNTGETESTVPIIPATSNVYSVTRNILETQKTG